MIMFYNIACKLQDECDFACVSECVHCDESESDRSVAIMKDAETFASTLSVLLSEANSMFHSEDASNLIPMIARVGGMLIVAQCSLDALNSMVCKPRSSVVNDTSATKGI